MLLKFAGIKWRKSRKVWNACSCFHQKLRKLKLIVFVAVDEGRMSTQKCRRFPPDRCNLVLNACLFPSKIEEVRINCICCSWNKDVAKLCWNAWLFPSKIEDVRINWICCSWRRTNVDTEMQTIHPGSLQIGFETKIKNWGS